jgi:hypothetical protein
MNLLGENGGPRYKDDWSPRHSKCISDTHRSTKIISNTESTKIYMRVKQMCQCGGVKKVKFSLTGLNWPRGWIEV